ncbi:hypothetical protein Q3G72_026268 [Acer saccharum]|nr:hypothetical protein Q3G72_026268 [Acer saccharum]
MLALPFTHSRSKTQLPYTHHLIKSATTNKSLCPSPQEVAELEEVVVEVGVNEGLKLLKASMECKTVLTNVFFDNIGKQKTTQN